MSAEVISAPLTPVEKWLDGAALSSIYSSSYWNDIEEEKSKEWWIADGSTAAFARLEAYLERSGLMQSYRIAEKFLAGLAERDLLVADLAAGIGWTACLLSKLPNVSSVHAVDISEHRLEQLFPQAIRMFDGVAGKLKRSLGSFYDLRIADASVDVVFIAAAFHHAANPLRLLNEIDRVLNPGGHLILAAENVVSVAAVVRRMIRKLLHERKLCTNFYELFPPDDILGDHYYRVSDYYFFSQLLGYEVLNFVVTRPQTATVILRKSVS